MFPSLNTKNKTFELYQRRNLQMLKFLGQLVSQTKVKKNNTANVSFKTKTKTNFASVAQQEVFSALSVTL